MSELTPREIVEKLDEHIVGQHDAKRAVAIALRNRWRWKQLPEDLRREVTPKNILMIGPTGVGKTEITRRLAKLTGAPFIKVEATKYTEVGYYGRDVESIIRELSEAAISLVRIRKRAEVEEIAKDRVEDRLLDLLVPSPEWDPDGDNREEAADRHQRTVEKMRDKLRDGQMEERIVELTIEQRNSPVQVFSNMGGAEQMDMDLQGMFDRMMPKQSAERIVKVHEAREILLDQEIEALMDRDAINEEGLRLAEDNGIVFIDEIDKICASSEGTRNADVSRAGVQRDLLPIVEGTTIQTRYGSVTTEQMLFIAAGAFHRSRPSDLMPELQGRFPIRVELGDLTRDDFVRILAEPSASLTRQYVELLKTDGIKLEFTDDGIEALADAAFHVNQSTQNIGARRLQTILERLLDDISFEAPEVKKKKLVVDADYVKGQLEEITKDEDLSRFIL